MPTEKSTIMKKIQLLALLILTSLSALAQVAKSPNGKIVARWDKNKLVEEINVLEEKGLIKRLITYPLTKIL